MMVKPLRKGHCPDCGRAVRRKWLSALGDGRFEVFQPYCARCVAGERRWRHAGRGKHGLGCYCLLVPGRNKQQG